MKIKKIILIFIIIGLTSFSNNSYAKTKKSCNISDGEPEILKTYLQNLRKVSSKIINDAKDKKGNFKTSAAKSKGELIRLYNSVVSWDNYSVEWEYRIKEPLSNNIPKEINRDSNLLKRENEKLEKILSKLAKRGYLTTKLKSDEICSGIDNCDLSGTSGEMLIQIVQSTKNLKEIIQRAGANQKNNIKLCDNVQFIDKNSCVKLYDIYKNAKQECQDDKTEEKINNIGENFKFADAGYKSWKEAWSMFLGPEGKTKEEKNKYNQLEEKLLRKELARQGVGGDQTEQIVNNLREYNDKGTYSLVNNPISNIAKTVINSIDPETKTEYKNFKDSIAELFKEKKTKKVSIETLRKTLKKKQKESISKFDIQKYYSKQLVLAQAKDLDTNQIVAKIIKMNNSLNISINTLKTTLPISEKVCNSQGQGDGKCRY